MKDILRAIAEAIKLADRVQRISEQVGEVARVAREDSKELHARINDLSERVSHIEGMIEGALRTTGPRQLDKPD